jgi:hypothetical protein
MKIVTIAGLGWIPLWALIAWWAGFAPFPNRPEQARITVYVNQELRVTTHAVPFYGWVTPHWALDAANIRPTYTDTRIALYATYAACEWVAERKYKEASDERVSYMRWATEHHQEIEGDFTVFVCTKL